MLAVMCLEDRLHVVAWVLALDLGPRAHRNLNIFEIDTGVSENHADRLGSTREPGGGVIVEELDEEEVAACKVWLAT